MLGHPELGAVAGTVVVWLFFALVAGERGFLTLAGTATYLEVAAELGILAVAVTLLMIGGEFDLSVGSLIGASGMLLTILSVQYGWPLGAALVAVLAFAVAAGLANGGTCDGPPGLRADYHPGYYAAFLRDPDGNRVEAVCHRLPEDG